MNSKTTNCGVDEACSQPRIRVEIVAKRERGRLSESIHQRTPGKVQRQRFPLRKETRSFALHNKGVRIHFVLAYWDGKTHRVGVCISALPQSRAELGHGLDGNNTLEREIGLIRD